jgi:hypothetical protein
LHLLTQFFQANKIEIKTPNNYIMTYDTANGSAWREPVVFTAMQLAQLRRQPGCIAFF